MLTQGFLCVSFLEVFASMLKVDNLNTKATSEVLAAVSFAGIIYCEDRKKREWLGSKALAIVKVYMDNKKAAA